MAVTLAKHDHVTDAGRANWAGVIHALRNNGWTPGYLGSNFSRCGVRLRYRVAFFSNRQIRVTCHNCLKAK